MIPYYSHEGIEIYNCDARLGIHRVGVFDSTITSPPYNLNTRVNQKRDFVSRQVVKNEFSTKYGDYQDNLHPDEYYDLTSTILTECLGVSEKVFWNIQLATGNKTALFRMMAEYGDRLKEIVIWDKGTAQPAMNDQTFNSVFEFVFVFDNHDPLVRQFNQAEFPRGTMDNVWRVPRSKSVSKTHKATYPIELVNKCLSVHRSKRVLDPFMGSGTTLEAAKIRGIAAVGFEIDESYCEIAAKRLEQGTFNLSEMNE
jgi:site-specific DNA-methyltransferase (adenine-specific)